MTSGNTRRILGGLVGGLTLLVTACGTGSGTATSSSPTPVTPTHVILATLPVADTATAVLAKNKGYFTTEGLDVELKIVDTGPATTAAIVSGAASTKLGALSTGAHTISATYNGDAKHDAVTATETITVQ